MRPIWKGSINFGLVYIPVAVHAATKEEKLSFKQLRAKDLSPIKYKKVALFDDKEVPSDQIVKGYEYEKGNWVTLEEEDFKKVKIESTRSIEITDFVEQAQINPKFFYKPYFLEAQKGGEKGYALLHRTLTETGKIGIAKVAMTSREHLAAVKPDGLFLVLELMHFAHEVIEPEELKAPTLAEIAPRELQMAKALVEAMTTDWEPKKYEDQYHKAVLEMIEAKAKHRPAGAKLLTPRGPSNVVDLVAVLQESLRKAEGEKSPSRKATSGRGTAALMKRKRRSAA